MDQIKLFLFGRTSLFWPRVAVVFLLVANVFAEFNFLGFHRPDDPAVASISGATALIIWVVIKAADYIVDSLK